ncbi:MAG: flagellar M-ring protein FliF [Butyrivibrio sp.]|jgi:flagellar M-ring protein FliF|nr:flagellar M-ring protein FliF [Butyrivibrio sp.]
MPEKLKAVLQQIKDWWDKFSTKQKTLIVVGTSVAALTVVILVTVLTRPTYVLLMSAENTSEASQVKTLLDDNSITYTISNDGLQFRVLESQEADANILLGANNIQAADYSIDNVTNGSFSTTESDKQKKYVAYLETKLASDFSTMDAIDSAKVSLSIPEDDGTLLADQQEASASILLKLKDPDNFTEDNASYIAKATAAAIGNKSTNNIVVLDTEGNMLFSGEDDSSATGTASTQLSLKDKAQKTIKGEVKKVLLGTDLYDNVEVASNLVMDFSNKEETTHDYTPVSGGTQGVLSHENTYSSTGTNGTSGVPGTDTNNETTYVTQDNQTSSSTVDEDSKDYLPNEKITTTTTPAGVIDYTNSSISVTAINYVVMNQGDYDSAANGGSTWAQYKAANASPVDVTDTIDAATKQRLVDVVAHATGINSSNITLALYNENVYFDNTGANISLTDILQIVLIVVILGLLAFVILRSLRTEKEPEVEEQPEELSVEHLLESQPPEEALENIEVDEGSETKHLIEKFVDENPEAAANLLRNWLNEDYT